MTTLRAVVESYFADLRRVRAAGGATGERSSFPVLASLLNAVGSTLKPKVFCVIELAEQGTGHPDAGLFSAPQIQKGRPREGQFPERGVVEIKPLNDDTWVTSAGDQVSRYFGRYRLVLATNTRDLALVGGNVSGQPARPETLSLAATADEFSRRLETPRAFASEVGTGLAEFLARAMAHRTTLTESKDLAWLLASYARDGLARVEASGANGAVVRTALEQALGVRFEGAAAADCFARH